MSAQLEDLIGRVVHASGIDAADLADGDRDYVEAALQEIVTGLRARRAWEQHIGRVLTHRQVLELTGWSKQALSQAVRQHRVLRVRGSDDVAGYAAIVFDDARPARPLPGIKNVLRPWAAADPRGWAAASWLATGQPELGGRTPRQALLDGDAEAVASLARRFDDRLAA